MVNLYLVSSALNTKIGVFDSDQRLAQTLYTLASIRLQDPQARIYLVEMGAVPYNDLQRAVLARAADRVLDFTGDREVQQIAASQDLSIVKNVTETLCLDVVFGFLRSEGLLSDVSRVFKVSGRYQLTERADIGRYADARFSGKVVFAQRRPPGDVKAVAGIPGQYMSRLWSFDAMLIDHVVTVYQQILAHMLAVIHAGEYIDIEHCLCKFFPAERIAEVESIGVRGPAGGSGAMLED